MIIKKIIKKDSLDIWLWRNDKESIFFSKKKKKITLEAHNKWLEKNLNNRKIKFYIGDVRDYESINSALVDVNYVFHAAALKQVPSCEFYPLEAVKTNIIGTENVLTAAINNNVKKVICLKIGRAHV